MPDFTATVTQTIDGFELPVDITDDLRVMYDAIVGSMDWGSGFLDTDELNAILRVARACGFTAAEYPLASGYVRLRDSDGEIISALDAADQPRGWGWLVRTVTGDVLRCKRVAARTDAMIISVDLRMRHDVWVTVALDRPREVWADEPFDLDVPIPAGVIPDSQLDR